MERVPGAAGNRRGNKRMVWERKPRQIITLAKDQALKLINKGKIIPAEKAAYKIYSYPAGV